MLDALEFTNKSRALKPELDSYLGREKAKTENATGIRGYSALEIKNRRVISPHLFFILLSLTRLYPTVSVQNKSLHFQNHFEIINAFAHVINVQIKIKNGISLSISSH